MLRSTRGLSDLIQEILPAEFQTVVFPLAAETKPDTLPVRLKYRLEYDVLHEMTRGFHAKSVVSGYDRMTGFYTIQLVMLPDLEALLQQSKEDYQAKAKKMFSNMLIREFNAFLKRIKPLLKVPIYMDLTEVMAAADSVAKQLYLHQVMPKLTANITQSGEITPLAMQLLSGGAALLAAKSLRPLQEYVAHLESSLDWCSLFFASSNMKNEYDAVLHLLERLKKPLVGQTVKRLVDDVRVKLDLEGTIFRTPLAYLLNDLDGTSRHQHVTEPRPFWRVLWP